MPNKNFAYNICRTKPYYFLSTNLDLMLTKKHKFLTWKMVTKRSHYLNLVQLIWWKVSASDTRHSAVFFYLDQLFAGYNRPFIHTKLTSWNLNITILYSLYNNKRLQWEPIKLWRIVFDGVLEQIVLSELYY